jgi:hypothetical protein
MSNLSRQANLFDQAPGSDEAEAAAARARMRETIARLTAAAAPPWTDETGVFLLDGAFKRAMRLVPADEAEALWAEFDAHMERLYAVWAQTETAPKN